MRNTTLIVLVFVGALLVGCSQGTTAQGTLYNASFGNLEAYVPQKLATVHAAATKSVEAMGYSIETDAIDVREAKIEGKTALDKTVRVTLIKQGETVTKVSVSVGGNEAAGKELLDKIEAVAGGAPAK